jgi:hypothetical protein
LPLTSIATQSSGPRLDANTPSASGVVATRPADRDSPPSWIAGRARDRRTACPYRPPLTEQSKGDYLSDARPRDDISSQYRA